MIYEDPNWYPPDVADDCYMFTVARDGLPTNPLLMPTVGNGQLATVVYRDRLFFNGLYNGAKNKSHRAAIPAYNKVQLPHLDGYTESFSLDCIKGTFTHQQANGQIAVSHRIYAHRSLVGVLVNELVIERLQPSKDEIVVTVQSGTDFVTPDLTIDHSPYSSAAILYEGKINEYEDRGKSQVGEIYILCENIPSSVALAAQQDSTSFKFLMVLDSDKSTCVGVYNQALKLAQTDDLYKSHCSSWANIWQESRIDCWGSLSLAKALYGCQYYLYSSLRLYETYTMGIPFVGLSPESLAYGDHSEDDYLGHVFWDQETWMYPPILLLQPDVAAKLLTCRSRVIEQAKANAASSGYEGVKYPWEQAVTGIPVCPADQYEEYEIHINADISLAIRQLLYATGALPTDLVEVANGLADFWKSRIILDQQKQKFVIKGVMPPDEYHYPVDNSAYTNMAAQLALSLPEEIKRFDSKGLPDTKKADGDTTDIYVPYDSNLDYHPEFDGYSLNAGQSSIVKQADVILCGFPLCLVNNESTRLNDLDFYEKVTSQNGPAMTWSMFAIGYLELNQIDKATEMFNKQFKQLTQPFQVWTENPDGSGAVNFITGMGGFLQAVLNGYLGIRLREKSMELLSFNLPPQVTRLKATGISYRGSRIDIDINKTELKLAASKRQSPLYVTTANKKFDLPLQEPIIIQKTAESCPISISFF